MEPDDVYLRDVLIEFYQVGSVVKVSAIDPITTVKVSIVGNPRHGKETLKRTVIQKLRYVIAKQHNAARNGN